MGRGCCYWFSKIVLVIVNIIFFLAGALMLAFGITAKANSDALSKVFNYLIPAADRASLKNMGVDLTDVVVSNSTFMIVLGVIALVIAAFGLFGACCTIKWMLIIYAIVLILLLLAEIALIIYAAVNPNSFKNTVQEGMQKSLKDGFRSEIIIDSNYSVHMPVGAVEAAWAAIQLRDKCCGAYNYTDYSTFTWNNTNIYPNQTTPAVVPISCCSLTNANNNTANPQYSDFASLQQCLTGSTSYINSANCYDAVKKQIDDFIRDYKGIAIGIAAGIVGLELILIVMTFILFCTHKGDDKYV